VVEKLSGAVRDGGFLLFQEMRLLPEVESTLWVRWLCEGGLQIRKLFDRRPGLKLLSDRIDANYITVLYQKADLHYTSPSPGWKRLVPEFLKLAYRNLRVVLKLVNKLDFTSAKQFSDSCGLVRSILKAYKFSLITPLGLTQLYKLVRELDASGVQGDFVECGVYRGGSAALLGMALNSSPLARELWLFDSFQGLPAADTIDGPSAATLGRKLVSNSEDVRRLLDKCGVPVGKSHIFPGWFNETLSSAPIRRVALLHLDADWYASTKQCLEHFYDLISLGGVIVLDDYAEWPGCKAALDEFAAKRSLNIKLEGGTETPVYFRKTQ
jgi:O-methyltransferase